MEKLGRFDWHPDPAIDFCVEVDVLDGMVYDAKIGLLDPETVNERIFKAMSFNVGGVERAVAAKARLWRLEKEANGLSIKCMLIEVRCQ